MSVRRSPADGDEDGHAVIPPQMLMPAPKEGITLSDLALAEETSSLGDQNASIRLRPHRQQRASKPEGFAVADVGDGYKKGV